MASGATLPAIGAVACLAVLANNGQVLTELPQPVLLQLVGCLGTLLILLTLSSLQGSGKFRPQRYPATEWPVALSEGNPRAGYPVYDQKDPTKSFVRVCDKLIEECTAELEKTHELPAAEKKWLKDMLEYNVKGGKMNRGLMVVVSGEMLMKSKGKEATSDDLTKLAVLGWCIEWLQAWLLIADDFMDDSETRRGQPCWYKLPHVKQIALNDAFIVEMFVFRVLKRHFWADPAYPLLMDLFMETTFQTECGQLLDLQCMNLGLKDFTYKRWELIVKYKTAFYSFYLPVALGMTLAGVDEKNAYDAAREPLMVMGIYFQHRMTI